MKKNSILVICSDIPYPANHGGRVDVMQKLIAFKELGFDVELLVTSSEVILPNVRDVLSRYVNNIYSCYRINPILAFSISLFQFLPYQVTSRFNLKKILLHRTYDYILCESDYVFFALKNKSIKCRKKILRIHNDEAVYFSELMKSEHSFIKKTYYFVESLLFSLLKKKTHQEFDSYWFISNDEYKRFLENEVDDIADSSWIPPHMPCELPFNDKKFYTTEKKLLFVGNLFTSNNIDGIVWYLENVHRKVISQLNNVSLTIAGNGKGNVPAVLLNAVENLSSICNVSIVEGPTDKELINLYDQSNIFINPMLAGAGVKLKTIDAMRNSMAVVSTSIGIEGTGLINGKHALVADNAELFCQSILYLAKNSNNMQEMAEQGYKYVKDNFNMKSKLFDLIGNCNDE